VPQSTNEEMMKKLILILLIFISCFAWADKHYGTNWVLVDTNDVVETYIDPTTIRREGTVRKFWVLRNLKVQNAKYGHMSIRTRDEIDCKKQTTRTTSIHQFSESMLKGNVTGVFSYPNDEWDDIAPGTTNESVMDSVCRK
jgi:hypothetical protein